MIAYLRGKVLQVHSLSKKDNYVVIDVNGIGYKVSVTGKYASKINPDSEIEIFTYHHITENGLDLFGFPTTAESDFFKILISISGIGPKTGLTILNEIDTDTIRQAVISDSPDVISQASAITKRTAEKIVHGLQGKVKAIMKDVATTGTKAGSDTEVIEALTALGFTAREVGQALSKVPGDISESEEKIKETLKILGKRS